MKIVVVTGGIGSGKSVVCRVMRDKGWTAQYNADARVKALYSEKAGLLESLETSLGCVLRDDDGVFQPRSLAQVIFSDNEALKKVEALVFPALLEDFEAYRKENAGAEVIIFESATILEKPQFDGFGDVTVLVDAPLQTRLERACERDKASVEAVQARMANQPLMNSLSQGNNDPRVDFVLENTSGLAELESKVEELMLNIHKQ
jgi:dephospho-CoA kinase